MPFFESDFEEFSVGMDELEIEVKKLGNAFKQKIALQVLEGVVMTTRVDTGRARAGWQTTLGVPSERRPRVSDKSGRIPLNAGRQEIMRAKEGDDIWITNNVSYIRYLNYGTDSRIGDFMVERTLSRVQSQTE